MGVTVLNQTKRRIRHSDIRRFVKAVLRELGVEEASLSVVFVDQETIREYNRNFRGVDAYTDVMAFPGDGNYLGDVIIAPDVVEANAKDFGRGFDEELRFVVVHGILHLMGYTDYTPEEKRRMFEMQDEIIKRLEGRDEASS